MTVELANFLLPGAILFLAFILKLFIDRTVTLPDFIFAVFELPVDIAFLATTFVAAFIITNDGDVSSGVLSFIGYIIGSVFVVVLWRRSRLFFEHDKLLISGLVAASSYLMCGFGLIYAVGLLAGNGS